MFGESVVNELFPCLQTQLLSNEEKEKIAKVGEIFEPSHLPMDFAVRGEFVCGSKVNKSDLRARYEQNMRQQSHHQFHAAMR